MVIPLLTSTMCLWKIVWMRMILRMSKNFTSPVLVAPSTPVANFVGGRSVPPPAFATPLPPVDRHATVDATVRGSEPLLGTWRNLFANNRNMPIALGSLIISNSLKLMVVVSDDDLDNKYDLWKLSLVGYIVSWLLVNGCAIVFFLSTLVVPLSSLWLCHPWLSSSSWAFGGEAITIVASRSALHKQQTFDPSAPTPIGRANVFTRLGHQKDPDRS
ncbi:hypothetical protein DKX38_011297 [Salix brachista]|uniref:Uncharacterized protein n=1 Tax=Salix brachista TaxID=2182728 RepID=A0A5N5M0P1_9ROSI|nr:hypothetical protein DKX38_011297 [Salix brachista]